MHLNKKTRTTDRAVTAPSTAEADVLKVLKKDLETEMREEFARFLGKVRGKLLLEDARKELERLAQLPQQPASAGSAVSKSERD